MWCGVCAGVFSAALADVQALALGHTGSLFAASRVRAAAAPHGQLLTAGRWLGVGGGGVQVLRESSESARCLTLTTRFAELALQAASQAERDTIADVRPHNAACTRPHTSLHALLVVVGCCLWCVQALLHMTQAYLTPTGLTLREQALQALRQGAELVM